MTRYHGTNAGVLKLDHVMYIILSIYLVRYMLQQSIPHE